MAGKEYDWKKIFLEHLRESPIIAHAAKAAGISRVNAWRNKRADPEFSEAWDDAIEEGIDKAEAEAYRRAVQGYEQDVWYQGVKVGEQRMYSDQLLALILKGNRKRVYSDRTEHTGADGAPLEFAKIERVVIRGKADAENSDA